MFEALYFFFIVVAGTGGELCVSRAMKQTGEVKDFRPASIVRSLLHALRNQWMWGGVGLMTVAFFALARRSCRSRTSALSFLSRRSSYVAGALGGRFFLGERLNRGRWIGILLVCVGVTLVFLGKK